MFVIYPPGFELLQQTEYRQRNIVNVPDEKFISLQFFW